MKKLTESVSVRVNNNHKKVQGIISGYSEHQRFVLLQKGATELTTKDLPFDRDYTPADWEKFVGTKAHITLLKDLDAGTPGVEKNETEVGEGEEKTKIITVRRMYPTIGGISLSALMSGAKAVASKKLEAPAGAVLLRGREEEDVLQSILELGEPFASKDNLLEIEIIGLGQYKIKGVENAIKVVWWTFIDHSKDA